MHRSRVCGDGWRSSPPATTRRRFSGRRSRCLPYSRARWKAGGGRDRTSPRPRGALREPGRRWPGRRHDYGVPLDITENYRPARRRVRRSSGISDSIETYSPLLDRDLEHLDLADAGDPDFTGCDLPAALDRIERGAAAWSRTVACWSGSAASTP